MHRPTIGILAILLIAGSGALMLTTSDEVWRAALFRVGMLMAVIWLAYPQLQSAPIWLVVIGVIVVVVVLAATGKFRQVLVIAGLAFAVTWFRSLMRAAKRG